MSTRFDVAVYGATGYTGRQVVRELLEAGMTVMAAGRSRSSLDRLPEPIRTRVGVGAAGYDDPDGLRAIARHARVVVNTAVAHAMPGTPLARAALEGGAHYLDLSNAQRTVHDYYDGLGPEFATTGLALVPAVGFFGSLGDLLVSEAAQGLTDVEVELLYDIRDWRPSGVNLGSFLEGLQREIVEYDGGLVVHGRPPATRVADFGPALGPHRVLAFPAPEVWSIRQHVDARRITSALTTRTLAPAALGRLMPWLARATAAGLRHRVSARATAAIFTRFAGGRADREDHDPTRFVLTARVRGDREVRVGTLRGRGIYDISAPVARNLVAAMLDETFEGTGALAASQVVRPSDLMDALADKGLSWDLVGAEDPRHLSEESS